MGIYNFAERIAKCHVSITMKDLVHIDIILETDGNAILADAGSVSAELIKNMQRVVLRCIYIQERLFWSDLADLCGNVLPPHDLPKIKITKKRKNICFYNSTGYLLST